MPETKTQPLTAAELDHIRENLAAATGDAWHWAGNIDYSEPYLATWIPGSGRTSVMGIVGEDRTADSPGAKSVRSYAEECGEDPDELIHDWVTDSFGNTVQDPRLMFIDRETLRYVAARDHAVFEVAPKATTRTHPDVYRADITALRHPDAEIIRGSREWLQSLVDEVTAYRAAAEDAVLVPRSTLTYAAGALAGSGDNGDQYCAAQIRTALGETRGPNFQ